MKWVSLFLVSCCGVLLFCALSVPNARADKWNEATKVNFSAPVELPGVVLPAGTYWFTLMANDSDRNIVQVWDANREHLLTTIMTVPDYRTHPTGKTVIRFEERPSDQPEALRAWFYPGDNYGHEFVYSESRAREIAKRTGQPVLSMRNDVASNMTKPANSPKSPSVIALKQAHVEAINSSGQEVDKSQAIQPMPQGNQSTMPQH